MNPFALFANLLFAMAKILGYSCVCVFQCFWYAAHRRTDQIGGAVGYLGRGITDAFVEAFKGKH